VKDWLLSATQTVTAGTISMIKSHYRMVAPHFLFGLLIHYPKNKKSSGLWQPTITTTKPKWVPRYYHTHRGIPDAPKRTSDLPRLAPQTLLLSNAFVLWSFVCAGGPGFGETGE
jgi:hypothetical protein